MQDPQDENKVRQYYDRNTYWFVGLSRRRKPKAIHQPLFTKLDMSLEEALHTQHEIIRARIPELSEPASILDLGCGVGESMLYLARHTPSNVNYIGITISGAQATQVNARIIQMDLSDRVQVAKGSFQSLPTSIPLVDLAYSIESFIHSPDPIVFLKQVSAVLKNKGHLILFDDFLRRPIGNAHEQRIVDDLKNGWLANSLLTGNEMKILATECGLELSIETDFTEALKLGRVRDKWIHLLAPLARLLMSHSQYCRFLIGGDARQRAYQRNLLAYKMLVFHKDRSSFAVSH